MDITSKRAVRIIATAAVVVSVLWCGILYTQIRKIGEAISAVRADNPVAASIDVSDSDIPLLAELRPVNGGLRISMGEDGRAVCYWLASEEMPFSPCDCVLPVLLPLLALMMALIACLVAGTKAPSIFASAPAALSLLLVVVMGLAIVMSLAWIL